MRNTLLTLLSAVLVFGVACNKPHGAPTRQAVDMPIIKTTTTGNPEQPSWVDNADRGGVLTSVGIARPNKMGDISYQRTQAEARGFASLAKKLQAYTLTQYQEMHKQNMSDSNSASNQELAQSNDFVRVFASEKMKGARVTQYWRNKLTGDLYVLCELDPRGAREHAEVKQTELKTAVKEAEQTEDRQEAKNAKN